MELKTIIAFGLACLGIGCGVAFGYGFSIPQEGKMVRDAEAIVEGIVARDGEEVWLKEAKWLKGSASEGTEVRLGSRFHSAIFDLAEWGLAQEGRRVICLGYVGQDNAFMLQWAYGSCWQGIGTSGALADAGVGKAEAFVADVLRFAALAEREGEAAVVKALADAWSSGNRCPVLGYLFAYGRGRESIGTPLETLVWRVIDDILTMKEDNAETWWCREWIMLMRGWTTTRHGWKRLPDSEIVPWMVRVARGTGPLADYASRLLQSCWKFNGGETMEKWLAEKLPGWIAEDAAIRETLAPLPE